MTSRRTKPNRTIRRLVIWYRRNAAITSLAESASAAGSMAGSVAGAATSVAGAATSVAGNVLQPLVFDPLRRLQQSGIEGEDAVPRPRAVADGVPGRGSTAHVSRPRSGRYLVWAELLRRVFEIDVLKCPTCGGRLRLVSVILDGLSARRYLKGASRVPEPAARPPPPQRDGRAAGA
jgi:hypothetical protein